MDKQGIELAKIKHSYGMYSCHHNNVLKDKLKNQLIIKLSILTLFSILLRAILLPGKTESESGWCQVDHQETTAKSRSNIFF